MCLPCIPMYPPEGVFGTDVHLFRVPDANMQGLPWYEGVAGDDQIQQLDADDLNQI